MNTHTVLLNELQAISMKNWRQLGVFSKGYYRQSLRWLRTGDAVDIIIDTIRVPSVRFICSDADYCIPLVQKRTNTGIGTTWYFSPEPGMYCRKLYLFEGRFRGRKQIPGAVYHCQVVFGKRKRIDQAKSLLKKIEQLRKYQQRKYYKPTYGKKSTKHQLKLQAALEEMKMLAKVNLLK